MAKASVAKRGGAGESSLRSPAGLAIEAELSGNGALVRSEQQAAALWSHGCFGKGLLSRSRPERLEGGEPAKRAKSAKGGKERPRPTSDNPFHGTALERPRTLAALLGTQHEPVHLMPEETLYLMHAERCLTLTGVPPDFGPEQLWAHFAGLQQRFPLLYFAYVHYRRQGWVVRAGSKMGCDLTLYQDNPAKMHAQHSVLVLDARAPMPSWPELLGIGRVSENVKKNLLLCRVELPDRPTTTLANIFEARVVHELRYSRWAPSSTREEAGSTPDWPDSDG